MTDPSSEIVAYALALHLDIDAEAIFESQRLEDDLDLDRFDLVLVVLRLEEVVGAEFPLAVLDYVVTVGDLTRVVRAWAAGRAAKVERGHVAQAAR